MSAGTPIPGWTRPILALAQRLAPPHRRRAWRRQWDAEVAHFVGLRGSAGLLRFTLGAMAHAFYLRREEGRMRGFVGEMRTVVRSLLKRPGFTALSVVTLAVGIGAATAVFSMAEAVLLRPLPLEHGDRLVRLYTSNPSRGMDRFSVSYPDFVDWTGRDDLFEAASLYTGTSRDLAGEGDPARLNGTVVFDGFFQVLGTTPRIGRLLLEEDQDPRNDRTVVLSEDAWTRLFGSDPSVLGRTVRLAGTPYTVVGVAAHGEGWPLDADFWVPARVGETPSESMLRRSNHSWQAIARLRPGVAIGGADAQVASMARSWYETNATGTEVGTEALVVPLRASAVGDAGPILFGVMGGAVFLVLLIACINQSNLLLTRALSRTRELSLRSALGAARSRLLWVMLGESTVLALAGGVLGVGLAWAAVKLTVSHAPMDLPSLADVRLNGPVLGMALLVALAASVLAGLVPALRASRTSVADALREGSTQSSAGRSGVRLRKGLVVAELVLSVVLLSAAGLAIRTFQGQLSADPGFHAEDALVFSVRLPTSRYSSAALADAFYQDAVRRLEDIPGVEGAGVTSQLPVGASRGSLTRVFLLEGQPDPPASSDVMGRWITADPSYMEALGIRPLEGRTFSVDDRADSPPVMIVTESFARRISPDQEIVGRRIRSWRDENLLREVVGVIPDIQLDEMTSRGDEPAVFVPSTQDVRASVSFLVRTRDDPSALIRPVRAAMTDLDGDIALADMNTLVDAHRQGLAGIRFVMTLFGAFGALALVLAVVGVYGLVSYAVSQRTPEIGIRLAMGATRGEVQRRMVAEAAVLAAVGLTVGLLLAAGLGRAASSVLFGLRWLDPKTFLGVVALLGGAALLAGWLPARRVSRVDPVEALRRE